MNDNNVDAPCSTSETTAVKAVFVMQPENNMAEEPIAVGDWKRHQASTDVAKQEPMDIERRPHSPNNDSGISPGHGSSESTSAGQPSPSQNGPLSSPEQYNSSKGNKLESNTEKMHHLSYYNQQHVLHSGMAAFWGINPLHNAYIQNIVPQTCMTENQGPLGAVTDTARNNYQAISPKSNQNSTPRRSPSHKTISANRISPGAHQNNKTASPPKPTSPPSTSTMTEVSALPGFNPGLSDDNNSRSSSSSPCSSAESMNFDNGYLKMMSMEVEQNPLRCLQMTVEQTTMMRDGRGELMSSEHGANGLRNTFQCAFCSFNTVSRTEFNEHNKTHCPDLKCNHCDFTTKVVEEFESHLREIHMVSPSAEGICLDEDDDAGIKVPRVNSQGKVKTLRCKQCDFVGLTKESFWNHCRTHIKPDKLLTCPRCPFVTEYKHHLEYHLRNHAKSKPFKCNQCDYSCVNKSMLNSHLKSHSPVYQYRCSDCSYLTKYCHSLKLHLRKYQHKPAMVLNPDGTPNPNPIIDVYGTRRGPKQRPRNTMKATSSKSKPAQSYPYPFMPTTYAFVTPQPGEVSMSYPYGPVLPNAFPVNNNGPAFPQNVNSYAENKNDSAAPINGKMINENFNTFNGHYYHMPNNNNNIVIEDSLMKEKSHQTHESSIVYASGDSKSEGSEKIASGAPLDLSKPEAANVEKQKNIDPTDNTTSTTTCSSSQKTAVKNRRKGQAFKLEHISRKLQQQHISSQESENIPLQTANYSEKSVSPVNHSCIVDANVSGNGASVSLSEKRNVGEDSSKFDTGEKNTGDTSAQEGNKDYFCQFCGITFIDAVLYTIHKGYHGYQDPFQCNMCGVQTGNKIEFNLHIARQSHC